jgi:hypothetical protein
VNYSEEMRGFLGVAATSGYLPVIYQPAVVSGLVASASSDSISDYIQITPGSIRDGLGRSIVCGRYESVNSLTAIAGWRFRPGPVAASWNVCVDAAGCVFIENQASLKASDEQGKIILATYTTNGSGVVSGFSAVSSPKCLRGIVPANGGGLAIPGTLSRDADDIFTATDHSVRANSSDASDNRRINITGGGAAAITRGAILQITGNEHATPGSLTMATGNVTGSKLRFVAQGTEHAYMDNNGDMFFNRGLSIPVAGMGIKIKEGTDACMGLATLVAGVAVVSTTKVTANSRIFLTRQTIAGTPGTSVDVTARPAGASFTITAQGSILDTSTVAWEIKEPA